MKQVKFFLVALMAVVMGMSVTSCMNGDNNTARQLFTIAKCTSPYPATFQKPTGQKLVINDASLITLNTGELYNFWYEYDSAEQLRLMQNTKKGLRMLQNHQKLMRHYTRLIQLLIIQHNRLFYLTNNILLFLLSIG